MNGFNEASVSSRHKQTLCTPGGSTSAGATTRGTLSKSRALRRPPRRLLHPEMIRWRESRISRNSVPVRLSLLLLHLLDAPRRSRSCVLSLINISLLAFEATRRLLPTGLRRHRRIIFHSVESPRHFSNPLLLEQYPSQAHWHTTRPRTEQGSSRWVAGVDPPCKCGHCRPRRSWFLSFVICLALLLHSRRPFHCSHCPDNEDAVHRYSTIVCCYFYPLAIDGFVSAHASHQEPIKEHNHRFLRPAGSSRVFGGSAIQDTPTTRLGPHQ